MEKQNQFSSQRKVIFSDLVYHNFERNLRIRIQEIENLVKQEEKEKAKEEDKHTLKEVSVLNSYCYKS